MTMCWPQGWAGVCSGLTRAGCRRLAMPRLHGICISEHGGQASRTARRGMRCISRRWRRCCMGKQWIYGVTLLAAFIAGWLAQGWRMGRQMAEQRAEHVDLLRRTAEANARVILQQQADQQAQAQRLADLDTIHTQELSHALEENRRLEDLYSAADGERRRLRIEVIVARNDATVSAIADAGSVGDAASLELSPDAGRTVFNLRRLMVEDQEKLEYLQGWALEMAYQNGRGGSPLRAARAEREGRAD